MNNPPDEKTCGWCRWWVPEARQERASSGDCHRHAPVFHDIFSKDGNIQIGPHMGHWPETFRVSFCGDFEPRRGEVW